MPTREVLLRKLEELSSGAVSRVDVAAWAMVIVDDDSLQVTDLAVWCVLKKLGAVDLPSPDRDYLYQAVDFDDWKAELAR